MTGVNNRIDLPALQSRKQFGEALRSITPMDDDDLNHISVRRLAAKVGMPAGTLGNWFAGTSVPGVSSKEFRRLLKDCNLDENAITAWTRTADRIRRLPREGKPAEVDDDEPPYRGLSPFDRDHAGEFFGREDQKGALVQFVRDGLAGVDSNVIGVVGPSGSGKSSLLAAGLLPEVTEAVMFNPTSEPDAALAAALARFPADQQNQVLVIDPCEELWTLQQQRPAAEGEEKRRQFIGRLSLWLHEPHHVVVFGLRSDYHGHASELEVLGPGVTDAQFALRPMTREQLEDAIIEPAARRGVDVHPHLVQRLLEELHVSEGGRAGAGVLPLLSHALLQTWKLLDPSDKRSTRRILTIDDYYQTGGIHDAVSTTADQVFSQLTKDQQRAAHRVFTRSVIVADESLARRTVPRDELVWKDIAASDVTVAIERFADQRLLTLTDAGVQISHEALLTAWPQLDEWIDSDRVTIMRHRRLSYEAKLWVDDNRDDKHLLSAGRTEEFQGWAGDEDVRRQLNPVELEFLTASIEHRDAVVEHDRQTRQTLERNAADLRAQAVRLRRRTRLAVGTSAVLAVVLVLLVGAIKSTVDSRNDATRARDEAQARQAAVQSQYQRERDPALAQQLALAGYRRSPATLEARSALLDSTAVPTPVRTPTVPGTIAAALTSDSDLLAVANADGQIRVFDRTRPGRSLTATIPISTGQHLYAVAFRRNSRLLAVGSDHDTSLWDLTHTDNPRKIALPGAADKVDHLAWSPDGHELAAATPHGTARWSVTDDATPTALDTLPCLDAQGKALDATGTPFDATAVAYSPDGALLATAGNNAAIQLWDRRTGPAPVPLPSVPMEKPTYWIRDLEFDTASDRLAAASDNKEALVLDVTTPAKAAIVRRAGGFANLATSVAFTDDGTTLAVGSTDSSVRLFDTRTDTPARQILPGSAIVTSLQFTHDTLITTAQDGFVRDWPIPGPVSNYLGGSIYTLPATADATTMLVGLNTSTAVPQYALTDSVGIRGRGPAMTIDAPDESSGVAAISDDGHTAAGGTKNGSIYLWDLSDPEHPRRQGGPVRDATPGPVAAAVFTPDSSYLFTATNGGDKHQINIIDRGDPDHPRIINPIDAGDRVQLITVSSDGAFLAAATTSKVRLWDISSGPQRARLIADAAGSLDTVTVVRFGANHLLATGSADETVRLWQATDTALTPLARFTGPSGAIESLSFDQNTTRLAAGTDGGIWVWDVHNPHTPVQVATLNAYTSRSNDARTAPITGRINDIAYGPAATSFTAAGPNGVLRTWLTDPDVIAAQICAHPAATITETEWAQYLPGTDYRSPCP